MIKTAGKNEWKHRALWTGTNWVSSWCEPENYDNPDQAIKIKEWQGLAQDPDAGVPPGDIADAFNTVFEAFSFEDAISELEKAVDELDEKVNGTKEK
jgi:hypothetical protein